jgi:hypothetical protein
MIINPLTYKQMSKCEVTYDALWGIMKRGSWEKNIKKRDCTRHFYEGVGSYTSGYMSNDALMLNSKDRCKDHFISPQTYAYYILDNWNIFIDFEKFMKEWIFCSQTIAVTSEENDRLKGFTLNNADTGNIIKVTVSIVDRYELAGIELYHDKVDVIDKFPFEVSEEFLKYERKYLLV